MKTTLTRAFLTLSAALMLLTLCASAASAQAKKDDKKESDGTILFGRDIMFVVKAPEGWVIDSESGAKQGVTAMFYPEGSSWKESVVFMYVNAACRCGAKSLEEFIEGDVKKFREHSPELKVSDGPAMKLEGGQEIPLKHFSTDSRVESVVYVGEGETILIFVLTSRTQKDYDASMSLLNKLVSSYRLVGTFPNKD
jgi:hypothetical protein